MYYTQEQIDRANQTDLVSFLQSQGEQLERAGNEYRWKRHDSLTVRGNKWYRHSQGKGGGPVDFLMEFFGKSFTEAVQLLTGKQGGKPDQTAHAEPQFRLPKRNDSTEQVKRYLTEARCIDEDVAGFFISTGDIYEDAAHHNAVFVGRDENGMPRYAHSKGTAGSFRLDVKGSDKTFNFCYRGEDEKLFVFEAPVDLLSFLCLFKKDWQKHSYCLCHFATSPLQPQTAALCVDRMGLFSWKGEPMNEQKKPDTAATNPIPLTETEAAPVTLVKKIGNMIFDIRVISVKRARKPLPIKSYALSETTMKPLKMQILFFSFPIDNTRK